jgi:hypothetical protein
MWSKMVRQFLNANLTKVMVAKDYSEQSKKDHKEIMKYLHLYHRSKKINVCI